ncbi:MAG: hypothetical protein V3U79_06745 [Dehalococcoidia bacterium]
MYLVRRVVRTQPGKAWEVAAHLARICEAYEKKGRNKAQIYVGGVPSDPNVAYAEWTQERIEPIRRSEVPESVYTDDAKMRPLLTSYDLEFYELVTPEKLNDRGFS